LGLALGRHLTDQDVARLDLGADIGNASFVQLRQCGFTDIRNICGDVLRPELGVARNAGELFDVDGGETVLLRQPLRDEDGVLEIVAVPRHEGDQTVLSERELTEIGGWTIGQGIATRDHITRLHQRTLINTGILVGARVLGQIVDVDTGHAGLRLGIIDAYHDARGIHRLDHAAAPRRHRHARVDRHRPLNTRTDQRFVGPQRRYRLTLHVGAHQGTVGIVMLQKGDQRSRH